MHQGGGGGTSEQVVEEASPIRSRPPATNLDELMRFTADGGGGGGSGSSSGNRWPREETLALLKIRSEMDAVFRDASAKGPLWEDVSRKLSEIGYKRSAKKCREKFENVQKYYKRTKEGRDGKTYKFFTQLEALNSSAVAAPPPPSSSATLHVSPLSVNFPADHHHQRFSGVAGMMTSSPSTPYNVHFTAAATATPAVPVVKSSHGISFSSRSSSTFSSSGNYEEDEMEDIEPSSAGTSSGRKRKRRPHSETYGGGQKMVEFFEGLIKRMMEKQEALQRSFLEMIDKNERERLNREESWKRQEMSRLSQERQFIAQEKAASASRDAAIISLIQNLTGQTIHLPPQTPPPPAFQPQRPTETPIQPVFQQPTPSPQRQLQPQASPIQSSSAEPPPPWAATQLGGSSSGSPKMAAAAATLSRWPKQEVLELINIRSGMETKYQDSSPKNPLWEEISSEMKRRGYNRSAKRCKEKWENINKYYKKVKESNKKRSDDAKTCPYFHQLDMLYRNKAHHLVHGGGTTSTQTRPQQEHHPSLQYTRESINTDQSLPTNPSDAATKTGDLMMEQQGIPQPQPQPQEPPPFRVDGYNKIDISHRYNLSHDDDNDDHEGLDEDDGNLGYKIELQQPTNKGGSGRGGNGDAPSFLTMVQ